MAFKIGDKAVYPKCGVGLVKEIATFEVESETYQMYVLKMLNDGSTIKVPVNAADANGMRYVLPVEAVERVYDVLRERGPAPAKQTWNRRKRDYDTRMMTGDPLEMAGVLKELMLLKDKKTLSFGERNMYEDAYNLVVEEVAVARDVDEEVIRDEISAIFKK